MVLRQVGIPGAEERRAMQRLAARYPERATHAVDLPYRLAWVRPGDPSRVAAALWHAGGELVAWAAWEAGSCELEVATSPGGGALWPEILAWGGARAREQYARRGGDDGASWAISVRADDAERIALLEAEGFRRRQWVYVHYQRALGDDLPPAQRLPEGFSIRPLRGAAEVPAYVEAHRAAFDSTYMNEEWRRRVLEGPTYRADLDLVVEAPDGRVAGFAIGWLGLEPQVGEEGGARRERREGQFEPVGVRPEYQRRGLGRALLLEGMRRLRTAGASHALVCTENGRARANALYASVMRDAGERTLSFWKAL